MVTKTARHENKNLGRPTEARNGRRGCKGHNVEARCGLDAGAKQGQTDQQPFASEVDLECTSKNRIVHAFVSLVLAEKRAVLFVY